VGFAAAVESKHSAVCRLGARRRRASVLIHKEQFDDERADAGPDARTDANTDANSDADAAANSDAGSSDAEPNARSDCNADSYCDTDSGANAEPNTDCDRNTDADPAACRVDVASRDVTAIEAALTLWLLSGR